MGFHFDSLFLASSHLALNGFTWLGGREWAKIGRDEDGPFNIGARIYDAAPGHPVVMVSVWED